MFQKINADTDTGEIELNYYGEPIERVKGLHCEGLEVLTRLKEWTIRDIETGEETTFESMSAFDLLEVDPDNRISTPFVYRDPDILPVYPFLKEEGDSLSIPWTISNNSRINTRLPTERRT